jgi:hypothetical protein
VARCRVEDVDKTVPWRRDRYVTLLTAKDKISNYGVEVFGLKVLAAGLEMPNVFSGVCIYGDDAA